MGDATDEVPTPQDTPRVGSAATAGGFVLFGAMGALYAMYGPVVPTLASDFSIPEGDAALVVTAHFAGSLVGILGWMVVAPLLGARRGLLVGAALLVTGAAGFASGASWPIALASAFAIGLGFGALLVGVTSTFAAGFGRRGAAMLNLLTATFGGGAILGPLAVSAVGGERFRLTFLTGAAIAGAGLALISTIVTPSGGRVGSLRSLVRVPRFVWGFVALFVGYVGVESGVAGFLATHLLAIGTGTSLAEGWGAGFWAAVMVGRFIAAPLALRIEPGRLVTRSLALSVVALVLTSVEEIAPAAYLLVGLAFAPVFPTGLAWLAASVGPRDTSSAPLVIATAQVGGVLVPAGVGRLVTATSATVVPIPFVMLAVACLLLAIGLGRVKEVRRGPAAHDAPDTATA
jgi:MFS transporter, FHS family, glucose/mannose:H+ symporter